MFDKEINRETQEQMCESINKMIELNEFGLSGFTKSFCDKCGNPAIFPEFFDANNGVYVERYFFCCPWQKSVLFGTKDEFPTEKQDCYGNCLRKIFENNSELRLEILERFKSLLEKEYYLNCLTENKPIKPLLSKWEQAIIESYEEKNLSHKEKEQQIHTERNYLNNMIHFRGTTENPINEELFGFWARFMTEENKLLIERFKRTANTSMIYNIHWDLVDDEYEKDAEGEYYYNHIMSCPQIIQSPIYRTDCFIQMSLFECLELNQTLFHFGLNSNNIILPATEELINFYNKYKKEVKRK